MKKNCQITLKLTEKDFDLLRTISEETGGSTQALIRQMINAIRKQWEARGRISVPIALADDHDFEAEKVRAKFNPKK